MHSLLVQEYLKTHSFGDLGREHGVYAGFHTNPYKFSLNYDMVEAKEDNLLACQCRGLVLATKDGAPLVGNNSILGSKRFDHIIPGDTVVLARSMDRFFNFGQGHAAKVDQKSARFIEKLDGSLSIVYWDPFQNKWFMASRGVPEANLNVNDQNMTFRQLFDMALYNTTQMSFDDFTALLDKKITYSFELCSPYNPVVVKYDEPFIVFIAARDLVSGNELSLDNISAGDVPKAREYKFNSMQDMLTYVSSQKADEHEGVIMIDDKLNRNKCKNANYIAAHHIRDFVSSSDRNCAHLILSGHDDDVVTTMPEIIQKKIVEMKSAIVKMIRHHDDMFAQLCQEANEICANDKKTFAQIVLSNKTVWSSPMFQCFDKKCSSMKDYIAKNNKDGKWTDSFLDKILEHSKRF